MRVLVACEESQRVCSAFRERGHEAYSCDIQDPSGGHPEWHIKGDALEILNPVENYNVMGQDDFTEGIDFQTMDGYWHRIPRWDLIIAHPPCTYLSNAGNRWLNIERYGDKARSRYHKRAIAAEFFLQFINADCKRIAVENPIGYMNTSYKKPDCIVYPYQFGESNNKPICLWLKGLQPLVPTEIVKKGAVHRFPNGRTNSVGWSGKSAKERSKTFEGIAKAMATQWG